jgi:probable rRNA maturation factor
MKKLRRVSRAPKIAFVVEDPRWRKDTATLPLLRRAARLAVAAPPHCLALPRGRGTREVTILLADDARVRTLNREFRWKDKPTNVLSFPGAEPPYLGDIAIAYQTVAKQARTQRKRFAAHAAHLTVHGILHLLSYDHQEDAAAEIMETLEIQILAKLGLSDPYHAPPLTRGRKPA